jgi:2-aminoadipate transaminase
MPQGVTWSKPTGGVFLWVRLPEFLDAKEIFPIAFQHKVAYVIGRPFHCTGTGANTLRLNYSFPPLDQIEIGIERLARAIKSALKSNSFPGCRRICVTKNKFSKKKEIDLSEFREKVNKNI